MKIKNSLQTLSVRARIILIFVFLTSITLTTLGVVIFSSWINSAHETTTELSIKTHQEIDTQIDYFFRNPFDLNKFNEGLIGNDYINMHHVEERERFFVLALMQYDEQVYSLGYGTVSGEYYGARRNEDNVIEIMRNNETTGGHSWYYSINEDFTAKERVVVLGLFDARTRPWYVGAANSGSTVFSSVYQHFVMDDLTVSLATPIYNENGELEGVLAAHMVLSNINEFLSNTLKESNGTGVIFDKKSGELIANSMGDANYTIRSDNSVHRITIDALDNSDFKTAYDHYLDNQTMSFYLNNDRNNDYFTISEINENGISWIVITSTPRSNLFVSIINNIVWMIAISFIAIILMIIIYHAYITKVFKPIQQLVEVTDQYAAGDFSTRAPDYNDNEFGKLAKSFNIMALSISQFVNNLEQLVQDRTQNLEDVNKTLKESEQRFKVLHNASFGGIAVHDSGYILECNQGLSDITGYSMKELVGMDGLLLIAPDYRDFVMDKITSGYEKAYEAYGIRKNKEVYPLKLEARNIPYGGKQVRVVEFRDITEAKSAEKEIKAINKKLKDSEEKFRLLTTEMQLGVALHEIIVDQENKPIDYRFIEVNGSFEKFTGLKKEKIIGKTALEILPDTKESWIKTYGEVALTGEPAQFDQYVKSIGKYFSISAYSPKKGQFAIIVDDITDRKHKEEEIIHISNHDYLTNIPNRRYFQEMLHRYDNDAYYPLGIIMMDMNGLKLINDAYGHDVGNDALVLIANALKSIKGDHQFIARIGGDEFAMLCPNTTPKAMEKCIKKIDDDIGELRVMNIELSLAVGYEIKNDLNESLRLSLNNAENNMYKDKVLTGKSDRNDAIKSVLQTLQAKYGEEKIHSERVSNYCKKIGVALNLRKDEVLELEMAGLYHDIGKISIPDAILDKPGKLTQDEWTIMKTHTLNGYQILRTADRYSKIAEYAMSHHERIDGKGYPNGLKGEDIPLFSRIICVADAYEAMTSNRPYRKSINKDSAIKELKKHSKTQFDSEIVEMFINKVLNLEP